MLSLPWKCKQHPCVLSPNTSSCLPSLLHYSLSLLKKTAEILEKRAKRGKNNFYTLLPSSVYRTDSPPSALHVVIFLLQCIWYYICCFFSNHHDNDRRANWVLPHGLSALCFWFYYWRSFNLSFGQLKVLRSYVHKINFLKKGRAKKEIPFCDITFFHGEWQGSFDEPPTLLPFVLTKCYEHYSWLPAQPSSSRGWGTLLSQCFHRHLPTEEKLKSFIANFMENAVCVNQVFCVCFGGTGPKNIWLLCPNHSNLLQSQSVIPHSGSLLLAAHLEERPSHVHPATA